MMMESLLRMASRLLLKPLLGSSFSVSFHRRVLSLVAKGLPPPRGTRCAPLTMNGVAAERVEQGPCAADRAILFFHGGGYCIGSPATHRSLTGRLARLTGAPVYVPHYRLAPEHPHPAAVEDAVKAYRWLLAQNIAPHCIVIAGDSAGGGLSLACALALSTSNLPLPAALVLLSPWTDLSCGGDTMISHARRDPVLTPAGLRYWAQCYLAGGDAQSPPCSPLNADLSKLPPVLIQVGSEEILLSDARRLHRKARESGVDCELHEYEGLWHDFHLQGSMLKRANEALQKIANFIDRRWQ